MERRQRQGRRLMQVCVRALWSPCLEGYVEGYEAGSLQHGKGSLCAIGSMTEGSYYDDLNRLRPADDTVGWHWRAVAHIERFFEGYHSDMRLIGQEMMGVDDRPTASISWSRIPSAERRRILYEACVEELARRASERVERRVAPRPSSVSNQ